MTSCYPPSQYSLFPTCPPLPPQNSTNGNIAIFSSQPLPTAVRERAGWPETATNTTRDKANNIIVHKLLKHSKAMGRLIPFKLQPVEKELPSPPKAPSPQPQITSNPQRKPRPGPVTDLTILPYTHEEWKKVMEEIKTLYLKGQHRHCTMRCKQILNAIKDPDRVHPLYLIYTSFYAASSLEQMARSLHNHSSSKLPLFHDSLTYYQKAESHIDRTSFAAGPDLTVLTRRSSSHSTYSVASSIRSSVSSVFSSQSSSAGSACSSIASSPTEPETSKRTVSTSSMASGPRSVKKRVSFSTQIKMLESEHPADEATMIDAFPCPPSQPDRISTSRMHASLPPLPTGAESETLSAYLLAQSVSRYRTHLASLSEQLQYHISSIHAQIGQLSATRRARRGNAPDVFAEEEVEVDGVGREEMKRVEMRERIRRLKESGWKRERFDGERYRVLCEKALGVAVERERV